MKNMKKIFALMFSIFVLFGTITLGSIFLTGCQSEQGGEENNKPGENENNRESPQNDENNEDEPIDSNYTTEHNFTVKIRVKQIGGDYYEDWVSDDTNDRTSIASRCSFDLYWYKDDGSSGNLTSSSENYITNSSYGYSWANSSTSSSTQKTGLIYANYTYNNVFSYKRYAKIVPKVNGTEAKFFQGYNSDSGYVAINPFYIYGSSGITRYASTAQSNCTAKLTGTFEAIFRESATYSFYGSSVDGEQNTVLQTVIGYANGNITLPTYTRSIPLGYHFAGWYWRGGGSLFNEGASFSVDDNYNPHVSWNAFEAQVVANTYTVSFNGNGSTSGSKSDVTAYYDSWYSVDNPFTKTGYSFAGWTITGLDTVTHYYGSSTSNYSTSTATSITYSTTGTTYYKNLRSTSIKVTFTARWTINTYTLTVNYYSMLATNSTALNVTQADSTVSGSGCASGGSATVSHTYTTTSYSVTLARANTSYNYYISVGSSATTSSSLNSKTYSWTPTANATINVYIAQRYTITYYKNNGTGTLPYASSSSATSSTQYKVHGTSVTLGTNNLTRTSYTKNAWNTNSSGTGTSYANGASYTTNANLTLYANWTAKTMTVYVRIYTDTSGAGSFSYSTTGLSGRTYTRKYNSNNTITSTSGSSTSNNVSHGQLQQQAFTTTVTPKDGYVFVGFTQSTTSTTSTITSTGTNDFLYPTNTDTPSTTYRFTPTSGTTQYIYAFFKQKSGNLLQYDSTDKYWYFENGELPQSYVGTSMNSTLNGAGVAQLGKGVDANGNLLTETDINGNPVSAYTLLMYGADSTIEMPVYIYAGDMKKYARVTATSAKSLTLSGSSYTFTAGTDYWFAVEPIRWRVSDYGVSSTEYPSGWEYYGSYQKDFTVVSDKILMFGCYSASLDVKEGDCVYPYSNSSMLQSISALKNLSLHFAYSGSKVITVDYYGKAGQQEKIQQKTTPNTGLTVASYNEIMTNLSSAKAQATDLVAFLMGQSNTGNCEYWTRDLSGTLGNGKTISRLGNPNTAWLNKDCGIRLSYIFSSGIRV